MKSTRFSIVIDPEFQSLVPPMSADSLAQLEQNIREHGLLDRLSLWEREDGTFVLIDGHHRYDVLQGLAQEKQEDTLADDDTRVQLREADGANREAVKLWILQNQVGRRNLTLEERTAMVAKIVILRQRISAEVSKANLKQGTESPEPRETQIAPVGNTVRAAAKEFGVPQRPLQAAVNAAKGKPAPVKTRKPHKVQHSGEPNNDLLGPGTARETFYIIRRKSDGTLMGEMGFYGRDWEPFTALRMAHISEKELATERDDLTQRYKLLNDSDYELIQVQTTYRLTVVPAEEPIRDGVTVSSGNSKKGQQCKCPECGEQCASLSQGIKHGKAKHNIDGSQVKDWKTRLQSPAELVMARAVS